MVLPSDPSVSVDSGMAATLIGRVTVAQESSGPVIENGLKTGLQNIVDNSAAFHEIYHAFSEFARKSSIWDENDVKRLREMYGEARTSAETHDEEKGAEAFRLYNARRMNGALTAEDETGPFAKLAAFADRLRNVEREKAARAKAAATAEEALFAQLMADAYSHVPAKEEKKPEPTPEKKPEPKTEEEQARAAALVDERREKAAAAARASIGTMMPAGGADAHDELMRTSEEYRSVYERYHNADGSARPGWLKAPNGKDTHLDPVQWVHVRTPKFMEWFGDWMAVAEIAPSSMSEAKVVFKGLMSRNAELQTADGATLRFASQSSKAYSKAAEVESANKRAHWSAVANIEQLVNRARFMYEENPRNGSPDVLSYVKYGAVFAFEGEQYLAKITSKKYRDRKSQNFYNVESVSVEKIVASGIHEAIAKGQSLDASDVNRIANILEEFNTKSEKSSKVVDENGEPLVVYRGSPYDPLRQPIGKGVIKPESYFSPDPEYAQRYGKVNAYILNIRRPLDVRNAEDASRLKEFYPHGYKFAVGHNGALDWGEMANFDLDELREKYPEYDGIVLDEGGDVNLDGSVKYRGVSFVPFDGGSQVKSADPVTYDDAGNVIPLSQRFNPQNNDIRYSVTVPAGPYSTRQLDDVLKSLAGKPMRNDATGMMAVINSVQRRKMESSAAVRKSKNNGFTRDEHNAIASIIEALWKCAEPAATYPEGNGAPNVSIHRFVSIAQMGGREVFPYLTLKQTRQEDSRIYSIELEKIETLEGTLKDLGLSTSSVEDILSKLRSKVNAENAENSRSSIGTMIPAEDAAYMDAVKRGDMDTAQRMVREAAEKAGYKRTVFHGTPSGGFNVFKFLPAYVTEDRNYADRYKSPSASSIRFGKQATNPETKELFLDMRRMFDTRRQGARKRFFDEYVQGGEEWSPVSGMNIALSRRGLPDWTEAESIADFIRARRLPYDGIVVDEGGYRDIDGNVQDRGISYAVLKNSKLKSADPVTYDDAGNVIPLSRRFNPQNNDIRFSVARLYTGSAADYANKDENGNIVNGPSLVHIGTGEGSQVYGWGLYASSVRGVAEGYAAADKAQKDAYLRVKRQSEPKRKVLFDGQEIEFDRYGVNEERTPESYAAKTIYQCDGSIDKAKNALEKRDSFVAKQALSWLIKNEGRITPPAAQEVVSEHIYEQTFFTNRAPGDESHLLKWYEPVSEEQKRWIAETAKKEGFSGKLSEALPLTGENVYGQLEYMLGSPKAASEFLARADIDGIKYPVDSYGGKTVKDGDKAGWNYVSFRDDNIRVDHKWVDGRQRFSVSSSINALSDIANGKEYGVLHNERYGEIRYPSGRMGKGGFGFLHIIEQRMAKDGATLDEAIDTAIRVGVSAQIGTETEQRHNTHHLDYRGTRAIIGEMPDKTIVITGYEIDADESVVAKQRAAELAPRPHVRSEEVIRALKERLASTLDIVPNSGAEVKGNARFSITPAEDAAYMDAVKRGDMDTAQRMVREAAAKAMPDTKVVGEDGLPMVVYHDTNSKRYVNRETGEDWDLLDWEERQKWDDRDDWDDFWEERDFYVFDRRNSRTTNEMPAHFFTPNADPYHEYGERRIAAFLNLKNPIVNPVIPGRSERDNAGADYMEELRKQGYDGFIREYDGEIAEINAFDSNQIKSADPVTYDDAGNVIPLSRRFNPQNNDIRYSVARLYTGSAADYANKDKDGKVVNGPSLHHIGTGEGSQVYGWGLYASSVRGVAEGYADANKGVHEIDGRPIEILDTYNPMTAEARALSAYVIANGDKAEARRILVGSTKDLRGKKRATGVEALEWFDKNSDRLSTTKPHVYEQTFFTNRAPGDESHLLKWYEPVGKENFDRIISRASKEPFANSFDRKQKSEKRFGFDENTPAGEVYKKLSTFYFNTPKAASEFLARADIDGIKYPVDSYGGKTVKDGDKAGWNYVSFRDDNIRVDHKWVDGRQRYSVMYLGGADLTNEDNARYFKHYIANIKASPAPRRLTDGSPKSALEWFMKNMVGKKYEFDIPGIGHRVFEPKAGHIGKLVCHGKGKGIISKPYKGQWVDAVLNGDIKAADVNGWSHERARSLPLIDDILRNFDAVLIDESGTNQAIIFIKKYDTANGSPNVIVMKVVPNDASIGPLSAYVKNLTQAWLTNKKRLVVGEDNQLLSRSADNSASRRSQPAADAENQSAGSANIVPQSVAAVNAENSEIPKISSDPETLARRSIRAAIQDGGAKEAEKALANYVAYFELSHGGIPQRKTLARMGLALGMKTVMTDRLLAEGASLAEQARGTLIERAARRGDVATAMALLRRDADSDAAVDELIAGAAGAGGKFTHAGVGRVNQLIKARVDQLMKNFTAATLADMEGETGLDIAAEILANDPKAFDKETRTKGAPADAGETARDQDEDAAGSGEGEEENDEENLTDRQKWERDRRRKAAEEKVRQVVIRSILRPFCS